MPAKNQSENLCWKEDLEENKFHDIVNDDSEMCDAIDRTPSDSDGMANQEMSIVQKHVLEVWSPLRETRLESQFGLKPGFTYNLVVNDEGGNPWDFVETETRNKCLKHVMQQKPQFLGWVADVHCLQRTPGPQQVTHESCKLGRIDGERIAPHEVCDYTDCMLLEDARNAVSHESCPNSEECGAHVPLWYAIQR